MNSKNKHTPGPWKVWSYGESVIDVAVGPEVGGVAVAQIVTTDAHGIATPACQETGQANAQLIAAAPELLEALELLFEHCSMVHNVWGEGCNRKQADEAIELGRQAIQKAKGVK